MELTLSHWIYLAVVLLVILGMFLRRGVIAVCVAGTVLIGWVYKGSFIAAGQTLFTANLTAGKALFDIILIIALMIALLRMMEKIGADYLLMKPIGKLFKGPTGAYWGIGAVKGLLSAFLWPTPATMTVGPMLIPGALRAGLPLVGIAAAMNLFGHGIALSGDFVIQGAPKLTGQAAGVSVSDMISASIPLVIVTGVIATGLSFWQLRRDMKKGLLVAEVQEAEVERTQFSLVARISAGLVPLSFLAVIVTTIWMSLRGGDATAMIGGVGLMLLVLMALGEYRFQAHKVLMEVLQEGFKFSIKIFAPVIPIAAFFFLGSPEISPLVLGDGAPGFLFDLGKALSTVVPLSAVPVAIIIVLVGIIAGLDGSGFSGLVMIGTLAQALGTPAGVDIAVLAALGQMASIWSGGGTLVPWGVLDIAGVTGIDPESLTRRNFLPVMTGLLAATVVAIFLM
ncbi:hypothetical protein JJB07_05020 [Tumebacillus sp. ITR2]|uniref:Transporter n=1 Tax=Tumebacillus amylolyticus TaxID=2801339 RepID=A0ABS1J8N9_9BACL|nr:hypothetical protein [Tumebacillus amylolyticus]MBL0386008.1 hypothetical protein [Tumebacillus amylolyticus]